MILLSTATFALVFDGNLGTFRGASPEDVFLKLRPQWATDGSVEILITHEGDNISCSVT